MQRAMAEKDVHRWVFVYNMDPDVEDSVRKWLVQRLDGLTPRDAVKTLMKATGLNPHLFVCGWPFCLDDVDGGCDAA